MYVNGFVLPVPADQKDAYRTMAEEFWEIARDYGCLSHVEAWEADIKDGQWTDFRKAVDQKEGEKIVFSWMTWPDKATADASHDKMMTDPRMEKWGDGSSMPFDGKRMIFGGFDPIVDKRA